MTPTEARKWLQEHNFVELPPGSYYHWLEEEWFEKYKQILVFREGKWIPTTKYLKELSILDDMYKKFQWQNYRPLHEPSEKEVEIPKHVSETPVQEKIVNAKGEELPF